mmetsp:Transcript_52027/g.118584  ORF Transcript_52027/g.118584 Transcript_52027/m.118584 type:complete len:323 (+) Transcript_52027:703-1671(+)
MAVGFLAAAAVEAVTALASVGIFPVVALQLAHHAEDQVPLLLELGQRERLAAAAAAADPAGLALCGFELGAVALDLPGDGLEFGPLLFLEHLAAHVLKLAHVGLPVAVGVQVAHEGPHLAIVQVGADREEPSAELIHIELPCTVAVKLLVHVLHFVVQPDAAFHAVDRDEDFLPSLLPRHLVHAPHGRVPRAIVMLAKGRLLEIFAEDLGSLFWVVFALLLDLLHDRHELGKSPEADAGALACVRDVEEGLGLVEREFNSEELLERVVQKGRHLWQLKAEVGAGIHGVERSTYGIDAAFRQKVRKIYLKTKTKMSKSEACMY